MNNWMNKNRTLCLLTACLFSLVLSQDCLAKEGQVDGPEPQLVKYKNTVDAKQKPVELKLHVFKPEGWTENDSRPAIVFFFGGGWARGEPSQFYSQCRDLMPLGIVAISAEYRVRSPHGTSPQESVEDAKSAIRYVRAHAKELGINPDMIAGAGGSAGGHVAVSTAILDGFEANGEDTSISCVPNLLVLFNPVIDTSPETGYGAGKIKPDPLVLSPFHHLHKDLPPTLIMHGDADKTVSIDSVRAFVKRSKELGNSCTLVEYEGAGHSFFNSSEFKKAKEGTPDYYTLTLKEAARFLEQSGYTAKKAQ